MYDRLFPPAAMQLPNGKVVLRKRSRAPLVLLVLILCVYASMYLTGFSFSVLFTRIGQFFVIIGQMIPPDWSMKPIWKPLFDTLKMSLLGSVIGALLALPVALLASANVVQSRVTIVVFKVFLSLLRTLPTLVSALIAALIFGLGTMAGTVAIMLFSLAYVGKLLYEQIENADMGPFEAMESLGLTRIQAFRCAILPQVLPGYLSNALFCFEGNVRYAAILGFVGAGGLGLLIDEDLGWREYPAVGMIILTLIVTVYAIETASEHFRKKLI